MTKYLGLHNEICLLAKLFRNWHLKYLISSNKFQSDLISNCRYCSHVCSLSIRWMAYYLSVLVFVPGMSVVVVARFQSIRGSSNYLIEKKLPDVQVLYIIPLTFEWTTII